MKWNLFSGAEAMENEIEAAGTSSIPVQAQPAPAEDGPEASEPADPAAVGQSIGVLTDGLARIGDVVQAMALSAARLKASTRGIESLAERHAAAETALDRTRGDLNLATARLSHAEGDLRRRAEEVDHLARKCSRAEAEVARLEGHARALADENERLYVEKTRGDERVERLEKLLSVLRSDLQVVSRERDQLRGANEKHVLALEEAARTIAERDIRIAALSTGTDRLQADLIASRALAEAHDRKIDALSADNRHQRTEIDDLTLQLRTITAAAEQSEKSLRARLVEAEAGAEGLRAKMQFLEQTAESVRAEFRELSARHRLVSDGFEEAVARGRAQAEEILRLKAEIAGIEPRRTAALAAVPDPAGGPARAAAVQAAAEAESAATQPALPLQLAAADATRPSPQPGPGPAAVAQDEPAPAPVAADDKVVLLAREKA